MHVLQMCFDSPKFFDTHCILLFATLRNLIKIDEKKFYNIFINSSQKDDSSNSQRFYT